MLMSAFVSGHIELGFESFHVILSIEIVKVIQCRRGEDVDYHLVMPLLLQEYPGDLDNSSERRAIC